MKAKTVMVVLAALGIAFTTTTSLAAPNDKESKAALDKAVKESNAEMKAQKEANDKHVADKVKDLKDREKNGPSK